MNVPGVTPGFSSVLWLGRDASYAFNDVLDRGRIVINRVIQKDIRVILGTEKLDDPLLIQTRRMIEHRVSENLGRSTAELTPADKPVVDQQRQGYLNGHTPSDTQQSPSFKGFCQISDSLLLASRQALHRRRPIAGVHYGKESQTTWI